MAPELLTVILASVSCVAFCLVILMLVVVLYRKDPLCCRFRPHQTQDYIEDLPHFHGRHSLVGIAHNAHAANLNQSATAPQGLQLPGGLFVIGKPHDYHMDGPLPRLPSYESVRKKDRQRLIHSMIAERFGLDGEPPPTYEETIHHSLSSADVHTSVHASDEHPNLHSPSSPSTASSLRPTESTEFFFI